MSSHRFGFVPQIVNAFARSKVTPLIILFAIFVGLLAVFQLPREEEPQISVPMFDIFVSYPGANAEEVEKRVVNLGERKLWEISGVEYIYSMAEAEGAMITVRFRVGEDIEKSLIKLYTKVYSNLDVLPKGGSEPLIKVRSIDDVPILTLTFHSASRDPVSLRKIVAGIQNAINAVPDVSETKITGGRKRQFKVFFDEQKLRERILIPSEISEIIARANVKRAAGYLATQPNLFFVEADAFFRSREDLENLVVSVSQGEIVYLKDVAKVIDGPDQEENQVQIRFGPASGLKAPGPFEATTLSVSKRKGANASWLCAKIIRKVEDLRGQLIPADVSFTVTRDYGETADEKSNELLFHMAIAVFGVSVLIALVLGLRESGVVAVAIPMTLALTLAGFYFLGFTLNRITLFALIFSIGILVDDPIVDVENIVRHMRLPKNKGRPLLEVTVEAVNEVLSPLILATLAVIVAILPMAFVRGLMGPYMRPIPIGASLAMFFSMVVSFIATPWVAYRILRKTPSSGKTPTPGEGEKEDVLTRFYRFYMQPLIYREDIRKKFIVTLVLLLLAAMMFVPLKMVKVKMLPFDNKNEFQVILNMPDGTPLAKTAQVVDELARYLNTVPEVRNIESYVGTSAPYNFNGLVRHYFLRDKTHQADLQVNLVGKDHRKRQSHAIANSVRPKIQEMVTRYGGKVQVAEVPPGPPVLSTLVTEVYGPTSAGQIKLAQDIEGVFRKNRGVTDVDSYVQEPPRLARLKINTTKASLNGVPVTAVTQMISSAVKGEVVDLAHLPEEYEPVDITLRLPEEKRHDFNALLNLTVLSRTGNRIPLRELVSVEETVKDRTIYHKNLMPVSYVIADVWGQFESPVYAIMDLKKELNRLALPGPANGTGQPKLDQFFRAQPENGDRWSVKWDGEWQITYEVFRDLGLAFAVVLVLIYVLVVGWFQSFKVPLIIMLPIPLTLIGILPAHWMFNMFFTATSMIGLIAGAGIVVRNSIILVDFIQLRVSDGMPLAEAVIDAGAKRFRPMLLTASAVVVGASVILFDPIFQGLALSLMAGEVASTILSRTAVPVIYYMVMKNKNEGEE